MDYKDCLEWNQMNKLRFRLLALCFLQTQVFGLRSRNYPSRKSMCVSTCQADNVLSRTPLALYSTTAE